jgi:hypothetical protein
MNNPAIARPPGRNRLALIAAAVLALLGSFIVTAPAQAGYYGDSYYGYRPCSYRCGYSPYRYDRGCSACGCWRRCHSSSRPSLVYERRYLERQYVERRYAWPPYHYRRHYGYNPYGGYRSYSRPYPWGDGGVGRRWPTPYGYRYEPSRYGYGYEPSADRYEEPPRPPAPVWDGAGTEAVPYGDRSPYGYQSAQWNADQPDPALQEPVAAYGVADGPRPLPRGPLGMIESGVLGFLGGFGPP